MKTIAEQIYPDDFDLISGVVEAIEKNLPAQAESLMATLESRLTSLTVPPHKLQIELFTQALRNRIAHGQAENLYLVSDQGQQIRMFNFMAEKFPVVRYAQEIANGIFLDALAGEKSFIVLDIGIGTGQQMGNLIQQALSRNPALKKIVVLGIEPSHESIEKAETRFKELAAQYNVSLSFTGIQKTVEQLEDSDWTVLEKCIRETPGKFLINASFALHHVQPVESRTALFARLKSYHPVVFVIIEPYADYTDESVSVRFRNAWHHYGLTFQAIDTLDAETDEKSAVKQIFFGREMIDVLSEGQRVEQFETAEAWSQKLSEGGFELMPVKNTVTTEFNPLIRIEESGSYLGFNVHGHPIVAVICAG